MEAKNLADSEGLPLIEWSRIETQLAAAVTQADAAAPTRQTYWLTTINDDGSPHVTSVGALWHAGSFWFQTGERTRKARNIARDARCTMSVATSGFDVMVEGEARRVTEPTIVSEVASLWVAGGWPCEVDDSGSAIIADYNAPSVGPPPWFVYQVTPRAETAVGTAETHGSTRWRF
jgi:Pyridoxamine 5'-phosphate oxidase